MEPILELKHIFYAYHTPDGETRALEDISFSVREGEFIAIVGPSGCGKSTLLHLIFGLLEPEQGQINIRGSSRKDSSVRIGYMLQKDELLNWRSVYHNVLLGLEIQHRLNPRTRERAKELLKTYGLEQFASSRPSELSGGMRQRAALIRTLVLEPDILLLDEPFSALDYQTRLNTGNDIGQIIRKEKKTAILVTHDISEAVSLADRILVFSSRPAALSQTVTVSFASGETSPLRRRNDPEFKTWFNLIWKELNPDA
ncbi:ABC transporter ATP-binding protein [Candidatus Bariatricus faecipullorum]